MTERWLIYGATGYTGRMLASRSLARGLSPLLAGRDEARLRRLAAPLDFEYRAARLDDPAALARMLQGVRLVLNAARPLDATAGPLIAACLATGAHYLDVTGEPAVFAALQRRDEVARRRGVMLLPGAGFVVVATDCLAAHVARRLPGAVRLRLGISLPASYAGRGSPTTVLPYLGPDIRVRRGGRLAAPLWSPLEHDFDYGWGHRTSLAVDWADVITAFHTTGISDIEVYLDLLPAERVALLASRLLAGLRSPCGQARVQTLPGGPPPDDRRRAECSIVAEAEDRAGRRVSSRLRTPDQYTFTADAGLTLVERVLAGEISAGFQTPARVYGADFVLGLGEVTREDLKV
ncbi:MAG TPA: saccharopine dehydrogenase NADP-binding domain-containing protein [Thermoanaerobaculia bacterium]|nr:saccharopine dehydrogenase NADP-binding domain-containing protein [Thermoanaerobaculia bacterium]